MELAFDINKGFYDSIYYMKEEINNNDLCLVCLMDEKEEGKTWSKTSLICGHVCHSRCYRQWCGIKNGLNCPVCGYIKQIKKNRFCSSCNRFGHCDIFEGCPKIEKQIKKEMIKQEKVNLISVM